MFRVYFSHLDIIYISLVIISDSSIHVYIVSIFVFIIILRLKYCIETPISPKYDTFVSKHVR